MQDKNAKGYDIGHVCRSLANSRTRSDVLAHLGSIYPGQASVDEISLATGYGKPDVIGALIGYRSRYRKQDSLLELGSVSCATSVVDGTPVPVFSIVPWALDVRERLSDYLFHSATGTDASLPGKLRDKLWKQ